MHNSGEEGGGSRRKKGKQEGEGGTGGRGRNRRKKGEQEGGGGELMTRCCIQSRRHKIMQDGKIKYKGTHTTVCIHAHLTQTGQHKPNLSTTV